MNSLNRTLSAVRRDGNVVISVRLWLHKGLRGRFSNQMTLDEQLKTKESN